MVRALFVLVVALPFVVAVLLAWGSMVFGFPLWLAAALALVLFLVLHSFARPVIRRARETLLPDGF